jgi:DNA-binding winged helix-turn-helix (wHTH) protein
VDYYFNNFQFNDLSLVLLKGGQPLSIRNNEAKLLAFFLTNPQQVFSKDAILENVWAGKVVSEQAVFQAISNLRTLFGDEAIKTFPKKGYQWQIPLRENVPGQKSQQPAFIQSPFIQPRPSPSATTQSLVASAPHKFWLWPLAVLLLIGLSFAFYFNFTKAPVKASVDQPISIIVQPFILDANNTGAEDIAQVVQKALVERSDEQSILAIHSPPLNYTPQQVAAEPAHFFNLYNQSISANLLVTGRVRQVGDTLILSFVLQGRHNQWAGYLTAVDVTGLAAEMNALLGKIASTKILWESRDLRLINAQLQLLYGENPGNLPLLYQLIDNFKYNRITSASKL